MCGIVRSGSRGPVAREKDPSQAPRPLSGVAARGAVAISYVIRRAGDQLVGERTGRAPQPLRVEARDVVWTRRRAPLPAH